MLKHCKLLLYLYFLLYHCIIYYALCSYCDRMVSVTAAELKNLFLKLMQCYGNTKQDSEPEVGRFLVVYHLHEKTIWLEIVQMERKNFN